VKLSEVQKKSILHLGMLEKPPCDFSRSTLVALQRRDLINVSTIDILVTGISLNDMGKEIYEKLKTKYRRVFWGWKKL